MIVNLCRTISTAADRINSNCVGIRHHWLILILLVAALTLSGCAPAARADGEQNLTTAAFAAAPIPIPNQPPPTSTASSFSSSSSSSSSLAHSITSVSETVPETVPETFNLEVADAASPREQTTPTAPPVASLTQPIGASQAISTVIGYSTKQLPIVAYHFGNGPRRVALVGGIHGGSEWNSVLLAYAVIDYLRVNPSEIPAALMLDIIPVANPDGLQLVTDKVGRFTPTDVQAPVGRGRFNGNEVDLNRNWACDWAATAWWGSSEVSGGTAPFSEVETQALRAFFLKRPAIQAAVFWHSAVPGVFAGGCDGLYPAAEQLAEIYATAADYPYGDAFAHYPITGDVTNWLSRRQIPAITVELASRSDIEWAQNWAGTEAILAHLAQQTMRQTPYPTPTLPFAP